MPTIPRTRLQRVLLVLLLVSASLAAAGITASFLMRAHARQMEQHMRVEPALPPGHPNANGLPPGHPSVNGLPPGHPPLPPPPPQPSLEGIRI